VTDTPSPSTRTLGTLRSEDGSRIVRLADRSDTDIDDLWSAPTDSAGPAPDGASARRDTFAAWRLDGTG
jgi:hypothetical protein